MAYFCIIKWPTFASSNGLLFNHQCFSQPAKLAYFSIVKWPTFLLTKTQAAYDYSYGIFDGATKDLKKKEGDWEILDAAATDSWKKVPQWAQPYAEKLKKVNDLRGKQASLTTELKAIRDTITAKNGEKGIAIETKNQHTSNRRQAEAQLPEATKAVTDTRRRLDLLQKQLVDRAPQYEWRGDKLHVTKPESEGENPEIAEAIAVVKRALQEAEDSLKQLRDAIGQATNQEAQEQARIDAIDELLEGPLPRDPQNPKGLIGEESKKQHEYDQTIIDLAGPNAVLMDARFPKGEALEAIPAHDVVDGWELLQRWQAGMPKDEWTEKTIPFGYLGLPKPEPGADYNALRDELAALADAADAVSDLVTAESVYQMVQGNTMRAGATLNAVASGETLPEYEVIRTPRSGVALTHRLAMLWSGPAPAAPAWSPRAQAEPRLNQWAGQVLGDLSQVIFSARAVKHGTDEKVIPPTPLSLAQLGMAPLDLIYAGEGSDEVKLAEIEQRAVYYFLKQHASVTDPLDIYLDFDASRSALEAIFEASRAIHALLAAARPAESRVFSSLADPADPAGAELQQRASVAVTGLQAAFDALPVEKEPDATTGAQALRERLLALASFGVPGAVPDAPPGDADVMRRALWQQAWGCRNEAERRLKQAQDIKPASQADCLAQLEAVFGRQLRVMPVFGPVAKLPEALGTATQQAENRREVVRWFQRVARVRDGAARLDAALMAAEAMNPATPLDLRVFQFPPPAPTEKWGALAPPAGGRLSVVAQVPPGFAPAGPVAGLIFDDWVEVVPGETETTGVAFHFDAPGSQPPQAILLAVPPAPPAQRPKWDMDTLADIVLETLELARLRTVTQETLGEIGHLLPASYFAFNTANDTVSTDFTGFEA